MRLKLKLRSEVLLLLNAVGIIASAAAVTLLLQTDGIVHNVLYTYGLTFSSEWAIPYWTFFRLAIGLLCGVAGISFTSMLYMMVSHRDTQRKKPISAPSTPVMAAQPAKIALERKSKELEQKSKELEKKSKKPERELMKEDGVEIFAIPMACNKCGKVFTQPLCMFDFRSGKPRLVNVCPYCNALLAVSGNSKTR